MRKIKDIILRLACGGAVGGGSVVACVEAYAGEVVNAVGEAVDAHLRMLR